MYIHLLIMYMLRYTRIFKSVHVYLDHMHGHQYNRSVWPRMAHLESVHVYIHCRNMNAVWSRMSFTASSYTGWRRPLGCLIFTGDFRKRAV